MSDGPSKLTILVLGGGGREHALCWRLAQSPHCTRLLCAPGNAGIAAVATCVNLAITDPAAVASFVASEGIGLVVIGPEAPLVAGVADALRAAGVPVVGPNQAAAQLEASKGFTKDLCAEYDIPTARFRRFASAADAHHYVANWSASSSPSRRTRGRSCSRQPRCGDGFEFFWESLS
jgi:phosphoribosylamine--glycine ligase